MNRSVEALNGDFSRLGLRFRLAGGRLDCRGFRADRFGGNRLRCGGLETRRLGAGFACDDVCRTGIGRGVRDCAGFGHDSLAGLIDIGTVDAITPARLVLFGLGVQAMLLGDQPFAVRDRDLVVVRMDFREG